MYRKLAGIVGFLLLLFSVGCSTRGQADIPGKNANPTQTRQEKTELLVSAAASLTDSLKEIQSLYEKEHSNVKLTFNFGSSGALQQQIEQGAPADLFISAGKQQLAALVNKQLIDNSQQTNLLTNELVVVIPADSKTPVSAITDVTKPEIKKLAIGQPETVPAGNYSKEALSYYKLWDQLQSKTVLAKDVRQVLTYVETGNADAGFVYKTDALTSSKVKEAFTVDPKSYKPIEYPMGIIKSTKYAKETQDFYNYLLSKPAQDIFVKYGFTLAQK